MFRKDKSKTYLNIIVIPLDHLVQQILVLCLHIFICLTNSLHKSDQIIILQEIRVRVWRGRKSQIANLNFGYICLCLSIFNFNSLSQLQNIPEHGKIKYGDGMYQQNNRKARLYKHLFHSYEDNQNAKEREKKKHFTFLSDKAMQASEQKSQYQTTNKHRDPFRIDY